MATSGVEEEAGGGARELGGRKSQLMHAGKAEMFGHTCDGFVPRLNPLGRKPGGFVHGGDDAPMDVITIGNVAQNGASNA